MAKYAIRPREPKLRERLTFLSIEPRGHLAKLTDDPGYTQIADVWVLGW